MFAAALAKDERLISAILTAVLDALPAALEQIEAAALQKPAPAGEPMTHWQRQALKTPFW